MSSRVSRAAAGRGVPVVLAVLGALGLAACKNEPAKSAALRCGAGTVEERGACIPAARVAEPSTPSVTAPAPSPPTEESLLAQMATDLADAGTCGMSFEPGRCNSDERFKRVSARRFEYLPVFGYSLAGCPAAEPCASSKRVLTIDRVSISVGDTDDFPYVGDIGWTLTAPSGTFGPSAARIAGRSGYRFAVRSGRWRWSK